MYVHLASCDSNQHKGTSRNYVLITRYMREGHQFCYIIFSSFFDGGGSCRSVSQCMVNNELFFRSFVHHTMRQSRWFCNNLFFIFLERLIHPNFFYRVGVGSKENKKIFLYFSNWVFFVFYFQNDHYYMFYFILFIFILNLCFVFVLNLYQPSLVLGPALRPESSGIG